MYQEFKIKMLGLELSAIKAGNLSGPTIIAMHGWLDNCLSFQPLLPYLQDFNIVAIDFTGHGLSDYRSADCYLHFVDYVHDLAFIMQQLQISRTFLLGHSLGGSIAALFSGLFPQYVRGLFLLDSLGPVVVDLPQKIAMLRNASPKYLSNSAKNHSNLKVFANQHEAQIARGKVSPMSASSLELLVKRNLKSVAGGFSWRTDPRLLIAPNTTYSEEDITGILDEITSPAALIIPTTGFAYGPTFFPRRQRHIKHLITYSVPGSHHVHMDKPELVGPLIRDFFMANS